MWGPCLSPSLIFSENSYLFKHEFKYFIYVSFLIDFRERKGKRKRKIDAKEKHQSVASTTHPNKDPSII